MQRVIANTGVQLLCFPLPPDCQFELRQVGASWNHARLAGESGDGDGDSLSFVQWRIDRQATNRLFIAVDTSCGDTEEGHFCDAAGFVSSFPVRLSDLLGRDGSRLQLPSIEFTIDPPMAGEPKDVDLIVDFGNSRTGALLLEMRGETSPTPQMLPFQLYDRQNLSAWNDQGEFDPNAASTWFSARSHWSATPYRPPAAVNRELYRQVETKKGVLGRTRTETLRESERVEPQLFEDFSMVRLGSHANRIAGSRHESGDHRSGLSSPKRYLWADDASWLEGGYWFMSPREAVDSDNARLTRLNGPLLRYITEFDDDRLLELSVDETWTPADDAPLKPRHAPRSLMTGAIYEIICQAFAYINSESYRRATGDPSRARRLRSVTLTYPTGMLAVERDRLLRQARKAAIIFGRTLGKSHKTPLVELGVDEASAVQLAYAWGELRSLGQNPSLWLSIASRREKPESVIASMADASVSNDQDEPSSPSPSPESRLRPNLDSHPRDNPRSSAPELRIACIDIGGGTTDLMIASYQCHAKVDDQLSGRILHRDGISIAGDQLVKRLLERVIVPVFAHRVGLEASMTQLLFGPEVPRNRELRSLRTTWMNRIFVPLAIRYLDSASSGTATEISHTDPEVVPPEVLASLDRELARIDESGTWDLSADLQLTVDSALLTDVVHEVLGELLSDFCGRIVQHQADLVLLAGQPTKLGIIQDLVRTLLPLPPSRVIPMHRHYAGNWYPYQDREGRSPGVIVDPKSTVVVGAAIEFLARHGHLPQFRFEMRDELRSQKYYWGVMTDAVSGIRSERVLFQPDESKRRHRFQTSSRRVVIGRRLSSDPRAEAAPVYLLKVDADDRLAPIDLTVELERSIDKRFGEEQLMVVSVAGTVAGSPAQLGGNVHFSWRTLADEHYYLDSGGLDNIDLG